MASCITCKAKRLKCDETKPSCQQCHKRSVVCGGYKKDFKWRPFEEMNFAGKPPAAKSRKGNSPLVSFPYPPTDLRAAPPTSISSPGSVDPGPISPAYSDFSSATYTSDLTSNQDSYAPLPPSPALPPPPQNIFSPQTPGSRAYALPALAYSNSQHFERPRTIPRSSEDFVETESTVTGGRTIFDESSTIRSTPASSSFSGQSPKLCDLLLPGTDLSARPNEYLENPPKLSEMSYQPEGLAQTYVNNANLDDEDDEVEEVVRQMGSNAAEWVMRLPSPAPSDFPSLSDPRFDRINSLCRQPDLAANSTEMLMLRFDKQTCGILSVKDGPTENPWRTLIWPLARESPALFHAIASMTAFHTSKERPSLRMDGVEHMRHSIGSLASGIAEMPTETALATTLALAFSESWDQHISTGIEHLRGAKILVNQALLKHKRNNMTGESLARLRFLVNTWVYMDVIARLTSVDDDESTGFDNILSAHDAFSTGAEVDPLMGCAATLFPLVGRTANMVRRVRKSSANSPAIISQASSLKAQIEEWQPDMPFEPPEDPESEIAHNFQTAEAYRWATLLYLHQAVPEIPSQSSADLAKKVLVLLATVPLSSRAVIVHIYPLLAAGCEVVSQEDRDWVEERWRAMMSRMWIGNLDRCWEVVKEVWNRRDALDAEMAAQQTRLGDALGALSSGLIARTKGTRQRKLSDEPFASDDLLDWPNSTRETVVGKGRASSGDSATSLSPFRASSVHSGVSSVLSSQNEDAQLERTVRGRAHWLGVMKDWNWEGRNPPPLCFQSPFDARRHPLTRHEHL
ncbi:MAG: hypothetical protein M1825_002375 [Sarcosagium campestre]|nr:MAG: hypothetical protein M1825_002375 [Sarcosagium campestre]